MKPAALAVGGRAALALNESVTERRDRADRVRDEVRTEAARHFNEPEPAGLLLRAATEGWKRLNVFA